VTDNNQPIDPATVQRCIEALKGSGRYDSQWKRQRYQRDVELIETWTYTTHPMDILKGLLPPPEKSEAEKLVDEWAEFWGIKRIEGREDYVRIAQFILDKQKAHLKELIAPSDMPVVEKPEPQYVYGPWIEWKGGQCPVPGDWMVQRVWKGVLQEPESASRVAWMFEGTEKYRVRFEVGKWYDWTGGPCPVQPDVKVEYAMRNGMPDYTSPRASTLDWHHPTRYITPGCDIIRFKVVAP